MFVNFNLYIIIFGRELGLLMHSVDAKVGLERAPKVVTLLCGIICMPCHRSLSESFI